MAIGPRQCGARASIRGSSAPNSHSGLRIHANGRAAFDEVEIIFDCRSAILECVEVHRAVTDFLGPEPVLTVDDLEQGQPAAEDGETMTSSRGMGVGAAYACIETWIAPQQPSVLRGKPGETGSMKEHELRTPPAVPPDGVVYHHPFVERSLQTTFRVFAERGDGGIRKRADDAPSTSGWSRNPILATRANSGSSSARPSPICDAQAQWFAGGRECVDPVIIHCAAA
jgi:hypothetical protein